MSWLLSFVVAILTGLVGMLLSGFVANLAVSWYRISSFEGGSGYFVVGMALLGFIGGCIIGLVTARVMGAAAPGFAKVLGVSLGIVVVIAGGVGGVSRALADVEPTIDGAGLFLAFELRWPATAMRAPADFAGAGYARLGSGTSARVIRKWGDGILFTDDAHLVEGRWVVPGVVDVWTARGSRLLDIGIGDSSLAGFLIPLPDHPGPNEQEWSDWLPHPRPGAPSLPDQFTYRFRVVKAGEAMRRETAGAFEVATGILSLFNVSGTTRKAATSRFHVTYKGAPIAGLDTVGAVALLPGASPALLVRPGGPQEGGTCLLVRDEGGRATLTPIGQCTGSIRGELLTADSVAWHGVYDRVVPPGWFDRTTFANVGLYRLEHGILDTRTLTFTAVEAPTEPYPINGLPPVGLSPDESHYVWFTHDGSEERPVLVVTDWRAQRSYTVPIDRARMRYNEYQQIDPAWVAYHFEWRSRDGAPLRLTERPGFTPLPYRGDRETDAKGVISSYYLRPGATELRNAIVDAMVRELGAERMPDELNGYHQVVRIDGKLVKAAVVDGGGFISIGMDYGSVDSALMKTLADQLDRLVATGKYDALFHLDPKPNEP